MDIIEKIDNSVIQHGKFNNRIYLMKLSFNDNCDIVHQLDNIANSKQYTKIFAKIPSKAKPLFIENGYVEEAFIPNFYALNDDAYFLGKYLKEDRKIINNKGLIDNIIKIAIDKGKEKPNISLDKSFTISRLTHKDAPRMAQIYNEVFDSYPFPIQDSEYLIKTMDENIIYYGLFIDKLLIALSSCEIDEDNMNVEMTDFACLEEYRGNNIAYHLLHHMEIEMKSMGIKTFYTIARAESYGMNITFSKLQYHYAGTLINNTNISGGIESMNVWYKKAY